MSEFENKFLTPETPATETPVVEAAVVTPEIIEKVDITPEKINPEPIKVEDKILDPIGIDHFKKIEELSGGKYKFTSDEDVKTFFETHDKIKTEFESRKDRDDYYDQVDKFLEEQAKGYNEEEYKKTVIANELGKRGHKQIAEKFLSMDLNNADDLELLSLYTQFQAPKLAGKDKIAREVILSELGVDTESIEDWNNIQLDERQQGRLAVKASEIRNQVKSLIDGVQVPKHPIKEKYEQYEQGKAKTAELKTKWEETITSMQSSFDKIVFDEAGFEFEIPEEEKSILKGFIEVASKQGLEPNEANKQMILQRAKDAVEDRNRVKIRLAYKAKIEADVRKSKDSEHHNLQPLTTDKVVVDDSKAQEAQSSLRKQMGLK